MKALERLRLLREEINFNKGRMFALRSRNQYKAAEIIYCENIDMIREMNILIDKLKK